ncbi:MAG: hypothetical protein KY432_00800 [Acidobacteria bacterium]|nr:hypothetical protein [Acidobacteriota bacterium]
MKRYIILIGALVLSSCTSTNFVKTGFDQAPPSALGPCSAVVLQEPPDERRYIEIGFCTTSTPGGGVITDKTPEAIRQLQQCACKNGGNAIVYEPESEAGIHTGFGYSQQRVKARATVLYVYPEETSSQ